MPRIRLNPFARALLPLLAPGVAFAGPTGGHVVSGHVTIGAPNPVTTVVDQTSHTGVVNWQAFNIGSNEYVLFNLPSSSASILNRVIGGSPSEILGHLNSNGRVFLVNPNGVLFGRGASVDVGGLFASTLDISNHDFTHGKYTFLDRGATGSVENDGVIHAADGGFVVLSAAEVANRGLIQARLGNVELASGSALTMDLDGDGLVSLQVTAASLSEVAGVSNLGDILAEGGRVALTADVARQLAGTVVNNQGLIRANGISEDGGDVYLTATGGNVAQGGTIDVSALAGHDAGSANLASDHDVALSSGSKIMATGDSGGQVHAVAAGVLTYAQGASTDVARGSASGTGGQAELSGRGGIRIHSFVHLGEHGLLTLDPAGDLIVGGPNDDIDVAVLEQMLQNNASTSTVNVVGSNSVFFRDVADGVIDGTNTATGLGASLLIGVGFVDGGFFRGQTGNITFEDTTNRIQVDGSISVLAGSSTGVIDIGQLSGASVDVEAAGAISVGNIVVPTAVTTGFSDAVIVSSTNAGVSMGDATGRSINVSAGNGIVDGGTLTAGTNGVQITSFNQDVADDFQNGPVSGVTLDAVNSAGGVDITASDESSGGGGIGIGITGATVAVGSLNEFASSGNIVTGPITVTQDVLGSAAAAVNANGSIQVNGLSVTGGVGGGSAVLRAGQDLTIQGDATVTGGGGTPSQFITNLTAFLALSSDSSSVNVTGDIAVTGLGVTAHQGEGETTETFTFGSGEFDVSADTIDLQGNVNVAGVGSASTFLSGTSGISIGGTTTVVATAATDDITFTGNVDQPPSSTTRRDATAAAFLFSSGTISTGDVAVTGPNAEFDVRAGLLRVGEAGGADALVVHATDGGLATGEFFQTTSDGVTLAQSTLGLATVDVDASGDGIATDTGVILNGNLSVSGPAAVGRIVSASGITIGGTATVTGTGYTQFGDFSQLPFQGQNGSGTGHPLLDNGTLTWGEASLELDSGVQGGEGGYGGPFIGGGAISVGDMAVAGIGDAGVDITTGTLGTGAVNVTAAAGQVQGSYTVEETIDGQLFDVTHTLDNGVDGTAANFGRSQINLDFTGTSANLGAITLAALQTEASLNGNSTGALTVGDVLLDGAGSRTGDPSSTVRERISYENIEDTSDPIEIDDTTTVVTGTFNGFGVGLDGDAPASFTSGNIGVNGTGVAALGIGAGATDTGVITLTARSGSLTSDDFVHNIEVPEGETVTSTLGNVIAILGNPVKDATIDGLNIVAAGDADIGVRAVATGAVTITAGGTISNIAPGPAIDLFQPVAYAIDNAYGGFRTIRGRTDLQLQDTRISAGSIGISLGTETALDDIDLTATGALTLDVAAGLTLSQSNLAGGTARLSGTSVTLSGTTLGGGAATIESSAGNVSISSGSTIDAASTTVGSSANVTISGSGVSGTVDVSSSGDTTLNGARIAGDATFESDGRITVFSSSFQGPSTSLDAGGTFADSSSSFSGETTSIASNSTVSLIGTSLQATSSTVNADGDVTIANATVGGDLSANSGGNIDLHDSTLEDGDTALGATGNITATNLTGTGLTMDSSEGTVQATALTLGGPLTITSGGSASIDDSDLESDVTVTSGGDIAVFGTTVSGDTAAFGAAGSVDISSTSIESTTVTVDASQGNIGLHSTSVDGDVVALTSGGDTTIDDSSIGGNLVVNSSGSILVTGDSTLTGDTGTLAANGDIDLDGIHVVVYHSLFSGVSSGGKVTLTGSDIGFPEVKAAGGGDIVLDGATGLTLTNSNLQGSDVTLRGRTVHLANANISGGDVVMVATNGSVSDGGTASTIDGDSLGVMASQDVDLGASTSNVGAGQTAIGGDEGLAGALDSRHLPVPGTAAPSASYVGQTVRTGKLTMQGNYLFFQANTVEASLVTPGNLFIQYVPTSNTASIGLENLPAATEDINLSTQHDFPQSLPDNTVVIGSTSFDGDIFVGQNGAVTPPMGTDVVLITNGNIHNPGRITAVGTVTPIGNVIDDSVTPPEEDPLTPVQAQPVPQGQPNVPVVAVLTPEDELIEQQTNEAGTSLVCQ